MDQWMSGASEGGRKICLLQLMGSIPVWIAAISLDAWLRESFFQGVDISPRTGRLIEVSEGNMINNFCIGFMPSAGIHSSIDWMSCLLPLPELP